MPIPGLLLLLALLLHLTLLRQWPLLPLGLRKRVVCGSRPERGLLLLQALLAVAALHGPGST